MLCWLEADLKCAIQTVRMKEGNGMNKFWNERKNKKKMNERTNE